MRRIVFLMILCAICALAQAQHTFQNTSLSEALIELDKSSKHYSISFVYDELEDFTVTKTIKRGRSLPDAVREVCGYYPIRVTRKGSEIFVECLQKDRTKLSGRLIGPDRQPVAYANITLYNPSDSVLIGGGVSNEAGDFVIPCSAAQARVRISYVGFKTIEQQMTIGHVGTIRMQTENYHLGNVTVSSRMPVIRSEADRLLYIVSNDEFARGHNALELLSRVPMVSMAGGRAMILGKGPAHFMLNGRVSEMGHEAIQQKLWTMRAEDIERIEVISIPSGRDIMEKGGGYINIVMRRDQTLGWRGDVSTQAGISDDWSGRGSGSVSYASEKFDMTADVNGGWTTQTTDNLMTYHINLVDDIFSDTHTRQTDKEMAANLSLRYLPAKNLEVGGMLSCQLLWPDKITDGFITNHSDLSSSSEAGVAPNDNTTTKSLTAYCDWHLDTKGKLLCFTYNNYKKDEDAKTIVLCTNTVIGDFYGRKSWVGYQNEVDYHIQSGRLDLTLPFKIATIDAGAYYTSIKNQGHVQRKPHSTTHIITASNYPFYYKEKRKAAYLSLHHDWDRYSIKAGLLYEHIALDREVTLDNEYYGSMDKIFHRNYWLPSLNFSVKPKEGHQVSLTWGTDCIHPNFYDLNSLRIYKTGYEYFQGDPELLPCRTSNIELSYHNRKGFYANAYYHHAGNNVVRNTQLTLQSFEPEVYQLYSVASFPESTGQINLYGLYLRYQHQVTPHLLVTAEGDASHHDYSTTLNTKTGPTDQYSQTLCGWSERLAISSDWYLNAKHTLLLNARYQHWFSDYTEMTKTDGYGYFYFALRYSMMDDRLKISLVANDPFHQHVTDETIYGGWTTSTIWRLKQMILYSHTNHHTHYIGLTASYSLGSKKVRQIQRDRKDTETQRAIRKQ